MKKIVYQIPEVKVKALYLEQLMAGGSVTGDVDGGGGPGYGEVDDDGTMDPNAKTFGNRSVWDD